MPGDGFQDSRAGAQGLRGARGERPRVQSRRGSSILAGVTDCRIEIEGPAGRRERALDRDLVRLGGPGADEVLDGAPRGELHLWNDPPKAVWLGPEADAPRIAGAPLDERLLSDGDRIDWAQWRITFRSGAEEARLEELATEPAASAEPPEAWKRIKAGLLVELGLAERRASKVWTDSVLRGEFQADAAARQILAATDVHDDDPRLVERASRLSRDLVAAPIQRGARGASRRAKGAAKRTSAAIVAQFLIFGLILLMTFVGMVLARLGWEVSFDGWIDAILGR